MHLKVPLEIARQLAVVVSPRRDNGYVGFLRGREGLAFCYRLFAPTGSNSYNLVSNTKVVVRFSGDVRMLNNRRRREYGCFLLDVERGIITRRARHRDVFCSKSSGATIAIAAGYIRCRPLQLIVKYQVEDVLSWGQVRRQDPQRHLLCGGRSYSRLTAWFKPPGTPSPLQNFNFWRGCPPSHFSWC